MESLIKEKSKYRLEKFLFDLKRAFLSFSKPGRVMLIAFLVLLIPGYYIGKFIGQQVYTRLYAKYSFQAKPSTLLATPIIAGKVDVYTLDGQQFSASVTVRNPNLDISVAATEYTINFYGQGKQFLATHRDSLVLLPNQEKLLVVSKIDSTQTPVAGELVINQPKFIKRINIPQVDLQVLNPRMFTELEPFASALEATIYNNSPYSVDLVKVPVVLRNSAGKIATASSTRMSDLRPYERRSFKLLWPGITNLSAFKVEIFPETDIFNLDNLRYQTKLE